MVLERFKDAVKFNLRRFFLLFSCHNNNGPATETFEALISADKQLILILISRFVTWFEKFLVKFLLDFRFRFSSTLF